MARKSFNTISENFVSRISGTVDRGKFTDGREGSGIWLRRPNNYLEGNVVTGAAKAAYAIYGGDNTEGPPIRIPSFQGADPHLGQFELLATSQMNLLQFDNNEAFASYFWSRTLVPRI